MNTEVAEHMLMDHDKRIDNHDERLDILERNDVKRDIQIETVCKNLQNLISTLKWGLGFIFTGWVGLYIYIIQKFI